MCFMGLRLSSEDEFEDADLAIHKIGVSPGRERAWLNQSGNSNPQIYFV
jgi:hypothetical protein